MRLSSFTALCAAPLALAGTLQADLVARGVFDDLVVRGNSDSNQKSGGGSGGGDNGGSNNNNNNGGGNNGGDTTIVNIIEPPPVIIAWMNSGGGSETTTINQTVTQTVDGQETTSALSATSMSAAATQTVVVGGAGGLVYTPPTLNMAVGDMVVFIFMSANHTVTQSAFAEPCKKIDGGMDSGFMANANNTVTPPPQVAMQVMTTKPIWFYCGQTGHCGKGMTFSINPSANASQAMFQSMAIAQNGTGSASGITGGSASAASAGTESSTTMSVATASAAAAASTATMASGQGTMQNGACSCQCLCGANSFPNAQVQGLGMVGGMSGAMPMSAMEITA